MKVSNCCGVNGGAFIPTVTDVITYETYELCPKCGGHCEYVDKIETVDEPKPDNLIDELRKSEIF